MWKQFNEWLNRGTFVVMDTIMQHVGLIAVLFLLFLIIGTVLAITGGTFFPCGGK